MAFLFFALYIGFAVIVAQLLKQRTGKSFWLIFALSILFSPLLVGLFGLLLTPKRQSAS